MENKSEAIETPGILLLDILRKVREHENRSGPLDGTFGRPQLEAVADQHGIDYKYVNTEFKRLHSEKFIAGENAFGRHWLLARCRLTQTGIDKMEELKTQHAGSEA